MKSAKPFIIVTEKTTADKMMSAGFQLVSSDNHKWVFLNDSHVTFDFKNAGACFTSTLTF